MIFNVGVWICFVYVEIIGVRPPGSDLGLDQAVTRGESESGQWIWWPGIRKHVCVPGTRMYSACLSSCDPHTSFVVCIVGDGSGSVSAAPVDG